MSPPTFLFYVANVMLVMAYLVIAGLTRRPGGVTGKVEQTHFQRAVAVAFFVSGAALHADMAWHAATLKPFFDPSGKVAWDFAGIIFFQMATVVASLVSIRRARAREHPAVPR